MFAHSRDPHPAIKLWCQVPFTKSKMIFQIEMYCMQCFLKSKYIKVELSMIKIGELLRKLWSLRSCFLILPLGALAPQGIKGVVRRDVSKHWCTLQWCASRGWIIAHENWTSWGSPQMLLHLSLFVTQLASFLIEIAMNLWHNVPRSFFYLWHEQITSICCES